MTHGEAQRARLLEAALGELYPTFPLRGLIERASNAGEAFSALCGLPDADVTEAEYTRVENLAIDTMQELLAFLLAHHGIDRTLARKLGDLL